jgi:CTP:phosphocholine cytidylyltransferase-like protein
MVFLFGISFIKTDSREFLSAVTYIEINIIYKYNESIYVITIKKMDMCINKLDETLIAETP